MSNIVACPHCATHVLNDGSRSGQVGACPKCHGKFMMPPLEQVAPPLPPVRVPPQEESGGLPVVDTSHRRPHPTVGAPQYAPPQNQGLTGWQWFVLIMGSISLMGAILRFAASQNESRNNSPRPSGLPNMRSR